MLTPKFLLFSLLSLPLAAQQDEIAILREKIAAQQKQIEELRLTLVEQQKLLESMTPKPAPVAKETAKTAPLSFRIGSADFTPIGFMDLTAAFRSKTGGSGIGTSFSGIPFNTAAAGRLTESRFSAQNSRVGLKVSTTHGKEAVTGYLEADFLGNAPANLNVTSNAATLRMRLYWVQVVRGKWEIVGGQSWSLLTPGRNGISPVPADIFFTQNTDTNYQVGLVWARQPQFRLVYHPNKRWAAAFALENPEQFTGPSVTLPTTYAAQFDNGSTNSIPNLHPDLTAKVAYDASALHLEVAGLFRSFQTDRSTAHGYAGSVNMNAAVAKNLRAIVNTYWSQGGGRYIFGLGPDLMVRPDGRISPVHAGSAMAGFEYQPSKNNQLYTYYGGAYFSRNFSVTAPGQYLGFGFPGSTNANRQIQEATFGWARTFWKNPNIGALQLMNQYSWVTRAPWAVAAGSPTTAHMHMLFVNLRYVLP